MKTIIKWFDELEESEKIKALKQVPKYRGRLIVFSLKSALESVYQNEHTKLLIEKYS